MTDDQELLALYAVEAREHLGTLNETLLRLEMLPATAEAVPGKPNERKRQIEALGRAAHSLKGASRAVGVAPVEKLAHRMESIFDAVQSGKMELEPDMADVLYDALDTIQSVLDGDEDLDIEAVLGSLDNLLNWQAVDAPVLAISTRTAPEIDRARQTTTLTVVEPGSQPLPAPEETIRVTIARLDQLMADSSDLLIARSSIDQRLHDLQSMRQANQRWQKEWRRVRTQYIRAVRQSTQYNQSESTTQPAQDRSEWRGLLEFLNLTQRYMRLSTQQLLAFDRALNADSLRLSLIADSLQDHIRRVRLVPFEMHVGLFQRTVRDLARDEGKEVLLQVSGANIELDKRVLDEIKDPILHLLRNAVDHGIELPAERSQQSKPRTGTIIVAISQRGSNVTILIADDGSGIDVAAVRQAARRILSDAEVDSLSDDDALSLIMLPGLSTSRQITTVSGRGIGMDVVRQNVEALQGRINIENSPGGGTTFRLVIPVSLSTLRCMLARIGAETYAIPTTAIEQIISLDSLPPEARFSAASRRMITVNGRALGVVSMADILERPDSSDGKEQGYVMILSSGDRRMAFLVDDLITEQETVVKNLNMELSRVRHVAGATLLGTGEVVIILSVSDLIKTAQGRSTGRLNPAHIPPAIAQAASARTLLIVDDSITTRTLEKNILEAAGYDVITATNGLEAFDALDKTPVSLIVADVEMPYMDGFELTARVRRSERHSHLPVILVTSLDTEQHKERGFHAGADAYIVKGNFNQGELLQTVRQLLGRRP